MKEDEYRRILEDGLEIYPVKSQVIMNARVKQKEFCIEWAVKALSAGPKEEGSAHEVPTEFNLFGTTLWSVMRECVLVRDNHKCVLCGAPAEEVHHIRPKHFNGSKYDPKNLVALCGCCHDYVHQRIDSALTQIIMDSLGCMLNKKNRTLDEFVEM